MEPIKTIKNFELKCLVGTGGMSEIYHAWDKKLNRDVAVKVIKTKQADQEAVKRFISEARVLAQLNHPNITQVYDIFKAEEQYYIVMEYLDGTDLKTYVENNEILITDLVQMFTTLTEAFSEVHQAGILHRDIKPSNLFVTKKGVIKIIDFGISKWDADPNNVETKKDFFIGSLQYTSPEVFIDSRQSIASDIYALGLTLLYCITGKHYFNGDTVPQILAKISYEDVCLPKDISSKLPDELVEFIQFCTEKDPKDRFKNMEEAYQALKTITLEKVKPISTRTLKKLVSKAENKHKIKPRKKVIEQKIHPGIIQNFLQKAFLIAGIAAIAFYFGQDYLDNPKIKLNFKNSTSSASASNTRAPASSVFRESYDHLDKNPNEEVKEKLLLLDKTYSDAKEKGISFPLFEKVSIAKINYNITSENYDKASKDITFVHDLLKLKVEKIEKAQNE